MYSKEFMLQYENAARQNGYHFICGVDEAGRGPLAGPVVVAAVMFTNDFYDENINDSKKLSAKKREELALTIMDHALCWRIAIIDEKTIDRINIYEASRLGMKKAIAALQPACDFALTDAMPLGSYIAHKAIIKGDQKSLSIAAASILAKVCRDHLMFIYDRMYPQYNFKKHKGYPTKEHLALLERYGPCPIHRQSFGPIKRLKQISFDF